MGKKKKTNQLQSNDRISIITWARIRLFRVIYQQNLGEMQIIVYCAGNRVADGMGKAHLCLTNNLME